MLSYLFILSCNAYQNLFSYTETRFGDPRPTSISSMDVWLDLACCFSRLVRSIPSLSCCSFDIYLLVYSLPAKRTVMDELVAPPDLESGKFYQYTFVLLMRHLSHFKTSTRFPDDVSVSTLLVL
jgi:hypothetical protein